MGKKIEIHYAVELTNNSINRGRNGEIKKTTDAMGRIYQYISSQCRNRQVREMKMQNPDNRQGIKVIGPQLEEIIKDELAKAGMTDPVNTEKVCGLILKAYGCKKEESNKNNSGKKAKKNADTEETSQEATQETADEEKKTDKDIDNLIVFLSANEIANVVKILADSSWAVLDAKSPQTEVNKAVITANENSMSRDVALFGRMMAANPALDVRGAVSGSDLIGVTMSNPVYDFYSSGVDKGDHKTKNLGNIEIASSVFYGFVTIDVDTLKNNIKDEGEIATMLSWDYLKDFVECFGNGREHSKFSNSYPFYVAVAVTEGNAFAVRHSAIAGKESVEEVAKAIHDSLTSRASNPNRASLKIAEQDETTSHFENFNDFIKENVLNA